MVEDEASCMRKVKKRVAGSQEEKQQGSDVRGFGVRENWESRIRPTIQMAAAASIQIERQSSARARSDLAPDLAYLS